MKHFSTLITISLIFLTHLSFSQTFVRVTTGSIVNDGGSSFGHSICDFNNDGWEDVFVNNLSGSDENFFYKNNGDGTFTRMSNIAIEMGNASTSSTWGDYNRDGHMDVFVANGGTVSNTRNNFLYLNNGDESFTLISDAGVGNLQSAYTVCSWLDVDNDTDLDLFVGKSSGANQIFKNDGDGNFTEQTLNDYGSTWGISWSDYDKDGDLDGFGTNWGTGNYFYKNENGNLTRISLSPLTNGANNSLSPSWGDYNNDGWMDLFVGNSAARDRLFQNNGNGAFTEINNSPLTNEVINSEGSCWADWDNDGDLDLLVSSGGNQSTGQVRMYENDGVGNFTKINDGELTSLIGIYEALSCFDYDRDGDLDIFISNYFSSNNLLYNNAGNSNQWINIALTGTISNTNAIGSKIYVKATIDGSEVWQMREVITHSGHVAQGSLKAHFGLGDATTIDSLIVVWPTQKEQILTNIGTNQFLEIQEDMSSGIVKGQELKTKINFVVTPNLLGPVTSISFHLKETASIQLNILNLKGQRIKSIFTGDLPLGPHHFEWAPEHNLARGHYLVSMKVDGAMVSKKVLVQ